MGAWDRVVPGYFPYLAMWRSDLKDFRQSEDFKRIIREGGMADYWRENGYPPQCRAIGEDDFACD